MLGNLSNYDWYSDIVTGRVEYIKYEASVKPRRPQVGREIRNELLLPFVIVI